jgi:Uma2 family endonuclease
MAQSLGTPPSPARPRMTFEEFLRSPYERAEWVDGEVFELSPENLDHTGITSWLSGLLAVYVEERDLGRVLVGFLMKTGPHLAGRVPDTLFLAREHESRIRQNYIDGPADLAIEVVSPDSTERDRKTKRREYEQGGVREYWIADPLARSATFFTLQDGRYQSMPTETDGTVRSRVIPGIFVRPEWLYAETRPKRLEVQRAWGLI